MTYLLARTDAGLQGPGIVFIILASILALPALYFVHLGLNSCCVKYARRFCRQRGLTVTRWRCGPAFDPSGVKTEFTLVELDCLDSQKQRRLVRLLVWIFGIRKVLDSPYPEQE